MIEGCVEALDSGSASGWCFNQQSPQEPLYVAAIVDDMVISRQAANEARIDLKEKFGLNCGFNLRFPEIADKGRIRVVAYDSNSYALLPKACAASEQPVRLPMLWGTPSRLCNYQLTSTADLFLQCGQNTGNLAYVYALEQLTGTKKCKPWHESPDTEDEAAIIPCANQLGEHCDMGGMAQRVSSAAGHVIAVGLGAQSHNGEIPSVPDGTLDWVRAIADKAHGSYPNISLRGHFTQKVLAHYGLGDVGIPLGCPSLFTNPDKKLGQTIKANFRTIRRLAVCCGTPWWGNVGVMERSLISLVRHTGGGHGNSATRCGHGPTGARRRSQAEQGRF